MCIRDSYCAPLQRKNDSRAAKLSETILPFPDFDASLPVNGTVYCRDAADIDDSVAEVADYQFDDIEIPTSIWHCDCAIHDIAACSI